VARQYGQYDLEKTATALSEMIDSALVFAADMVAGEAERWNRRVRSEIGILAV